MKFEDDTSTRDDWMPTVDGVPNAPTRAWTATLLVMDLMSAVDVEHHGLIAVLELPRSRSRISYAEARA